MGKTELKALLLNYMCLAPNDLLICGNRLPASRTEDVSEPDADCNHDGERKEEEKILHEQQRL